MWDIKNNHELDGEEFGPRSTSKWDNEYNKFANTYDQETELPGMLESNIIISTAPDGYNGYFDLSCEK